MLEEDGILSEISEPYFDSSRCAYLDAYEAAGTSSQNLTLVDMGGVFLVLGMFVGVSTVLWVCRRSPPSKRIRKWFCGMREKRKTDKVNNCTTTQLQ